MNEYIRFDQISDANASLEEFCYCMQRLLLSHDDQSAWKYAVISIQNALQSYICAGLDFSQRWRAEGCEYNPGFREWLRAYNQGQLLKKLPKQDVLESLYKKLYGNNNSQLDWKRIKYIHNLRNELIHLNSDGISIAKREVISCCIEVLKAVKQAPNYTKKLFFYEEQQKLSYNNACNRAESLLNELGNKLNA